MGGTHARPHTHAISLTFAIFLFFLSLFLSTQSGAGGLLEGVEGGGGGAFGFGVQALTRYACKTGGEEAK